MDINTSLQHTYLLKNSTLTSHKNQVTVGVSLVPVLIVLFFTLITTICEWASHWEGPDTLFSRILVRFFINLGHFSCVSTIRRQKVFLPILATILRVLVDQYPSFRSFGIF